MKALIAIAAMAVTNIASAAPQTIYFAGSIYQGTVIDLNTGFWGSTPTGGTFSGSITVDGTKGGVPLLNWPGFSDNYIEKRHDADGLKEDPIVSNFVFNYAGISYSKLLSITYDYSALAKFYTNLAIGPYFPGASSWGDPIGGYQVGSSTSLTNSLETTEEGYYDNRSRSLSMTLQGAANFPGDIADLATLPELDQFDASLSHIHFSNSSFSCQLTQGKCKSETVLQGQNGVDIWGRLTYLSTSPIPTAEIPEPGSLALVSLGIMGLAAIRKKSAKRTIASAPTEPHQSDSKR